MKSELIEVARTSRDSMKEIITWYVVAPGTSHGDCSEDCSVLSGRSRVFSSREVHPSVWTIQRISVGASMWWAIRWAKGTKSQRRVTLWLDGRLWTNLFTALFVVKRLCHCETTMMVLGQQKHVQCALVRIEGQVGVKLQCLRKLVWVYYNWLYYQIMSLPNLGSATWILLNTFWNVSSWLHFNNLSCDVNFSTDS